MTQLLVKPSEQRNVMTEHHDNRAVLRDLERQCESLAKRCEVVGSISAVGGVFLSPAFFGIALPLKPWLDKLQLLGQQVSLVTQLIESFRDEIEIHTNLQPPELSRIDFFLRFPDKQFLTVMLQSRGNAVVTYNQRTENLQYRNRKSRGLKNFKPDPLSIINLQTLWIAKERRDLKGGSSRDARRPVGKMIVLWGGTKISQHSDELYMEMSGLRTLRIPKYGSYVFIVEESQVIEAIRAYLTRNVGNNDQTLNAEKASS